MQKRNDPIKIVLVCMQMMSTTLPCVVKDEEEKREGKKGHGDNKESQFCQRLPERYSAGWFIPNLCGDFLKHTSSQGQWANTLSLSHVTHGEGGCDRWPLYLEVTMCDLLCDCRCTHCRLFQRQVNWSWAGAHKSQALLHIKLGLECVCRPTLGDSPSHKAL